MAGTRVAYSIVMGKKRLIVKLILYREEGLRRPITEDIRVWVTGKRQLRK